MFACWHTSLQMKIRNLKTLIPLLESVLKDQLEEHKDFDLKIVGSIPLYTTIFSHQATTVRLQAYAFTVGIPKSKWLKH